MTDLNNQPHYPDPADRPPPRPAVDRGGRLARALSFRGIFLSLVVGVCVTAFFNASSTVMWLVSGAVYLMFVFNDDQVLKCPACLKRVKLGASTCHHCGYTA